MKIQEILAANKLRQQEAKKLNVRAGETLFKVFSIAELTAWVMERLSGARRLMEIVNTETLRLPELDPSLVGKVLTDNPDKINVLGREVAVEYSEYRREPLIRIDFRGDYSKDWARLPVEGVRLPSNREVVLYSAIDGHSYYVEAPSSQFAPKVREIFNKQQWETWTTRPEIVLPDPNSEGSEVAATVEATYGTCVVTGQPLTAFGTVVVKGYRHYSTDPYFEGKWFHGRDEADTERAQTVGKLTALRIEAFENQLLAVARTAAEQAKVCIKDLYGVYQSFDRDSQVRTALYERAYGYLPEKVGDLQTWVAETHVLAEKARTEIREEEARRNRPEIREVRIDRRGQNRKPELNGRRIDSSESFQFTPSWFWSDLLALVDEFGRGTTAFAIFKGEDPLMLAMTKRELELLAPKVEQAMTDLGSSPTDEVKKSFWRELEGVRPKTRENRIPVKHHRVETEKKSFGLGADAWGGLDDLKL
ncbi:MAG: hypothetical protein EXS51_02775 [Candidatus Taylorbacteria bacterium]|nr:hypothetical protein [Candidatus Taylorbacteria bacterium]